MTRGRPARDADAVPACRQQVPSPALPSRPGRIRRGRAIPVRTRFDTKAASYGPGYLLLAGIWGTSFLLIKIGISELHPLYVALGRVGTGAAVLLGVIVVRRLRLPRAPATWGHLAVLATVGVCVPFTLFGYAERQVPTGVASIWNAGTALFVLPIATLIFRTERLTVLRTAGLGLGLLGVLLVLDAGRGLRGAQLAGHAQCLAAAACYAFAAAYARRHLTHRVEPAAALCAAQLLLAGIELAIVAPLTAGPPPHLTRLSLAVLLSVGLLGTVGTGVAFTLNLRNIAALGATAAATVTYLVPLVATLIGVVALGEHPRWSQPAGATLVLLGVAVSHNRAADRNRGKSSGQSSSLGNPAAVDTPAQTRTAVTAADGPTTRPPSTRRP